MLQPLHPIPAIRRGMRLHPDDPNDPWAFRVEMPDYGINLVPCSAKVSPERGQPVTRLLTDCSPSRSGPTPETRDDWQTARSSSARWPSPSADTAPEHATGANLRPSAMTLRPTTLAAVKLVHTLVWFSIESCMIYVLWAGFSRRSDRRAAIAAGVVAGESLVLAANGFRCPLTQVAKRVGAERGSVTDIYLPRWLAHNLPAIHVPLIMLAGYLHGRNLRGSYELEQPTAAVNHHRAR